MLIFDYYLKKLYYEDYYVKKWYDKVSLRGDYYLNSTTKILNNNEPIFFTHTILGHTKSFLYNPTTKIMNNMPSLDALWTKYPLDLDLIGHDNNNIYFSLPSLHIRHDCTTSLHHLIPVMNTPRAYAATVAFRDQLFVFGGTKKDHSSLLSTCECYNNINDSWTSLLDMPGARSTMHAIIINSNTIAILGGILDVDTGYCCEEVFLYTINTNTWSIADWKLPFPSDSDDSSVYMLSEFQELVIANYNDGTHIFDIPKKTWRQVPDCCIRESYNTSC